MTVIFTRQEVYLRKHKKASNEFEKIRKEGRQSLSQAETIQANNKMKKPALKPVIGHIREFISLLHATVTRGYKAPVELLTAVVAAILYLLWIVDVIPDFLPVIGYLDDMAIIIAVAKMVSVEINNFKKWKEKKNENQNGA